MDGAVLFEPLCIMCNALTNLMVGVVWMRRTRSSDSEMLRRESEDRRLVRISDDVVRTVEVVRIVVRVPGRVDRTLGAVVHRAAF